MNVHSWMSESSTLMPLSITTASSPQRTEDTKKLRNEPMSNEFRRLNMHLLLLSSFRHLVEWLERLPLFTRGLLPSCPRREKSYSSTMTWLRCLLSFCLLRSTIQSIRGAYLSKGHPISNNLTPSDLINSEALLPGPY